MNKRNNTFFTFIDLFAGIGGIRRGLELAGGRCIYSCEWDEKAQETYKENFHTVDAGDITKITDAEIGTIANFDILAAGFPCQAFSIAGLMQGLADPRGQLFLEIVRFLKIKKPKAFLLENVKNLLQHNSGTTYSFIKSELAKAHYLVVEGVLNTATHGNIPQNRERVFIVGICDELVSDISDFHFPTEIPLTAKLSSIIKVTEQKDQKYYYNKLSVVGAQILAQTLVPGTVYQWRRCYLRDNKSGVCPTLTANMGTGGHNVPIIVDNFGVRKLTPTETLLLQGFPTSHKFPASAIDASKYKQIGNSVSVPVVERVMSALTRYMLAKGAL